MDRLSTEDFLNKLFTEYQSIEAESVNSQFLSVVDLVRMLGYQYAVYRARLPVPLAQSRFETLHNLPTHMAELSQQPADIDNTPNVDFWRCKLAARKELYWGWTVKLGIYPFCNASLVGISDHEISNDGNTGALMILTAHYAHWRLSRLKRRIALAKYQISRREAEVLRWTGDGKSSSEIAELLMVSENKGYPFSSTITGILDEYPAY